MPGRGKARRSLELVEAARAILQEIQPATVRAVCYRLFVLGLISSMKKSETNRISTQLKWAREEGIIPWSWVVDETREPETISAFRDPQAYIEVVQRAYRRDRWADQSRRVQVWSEKGTVRGTLAPVLNDYGITFQVMHGFGSETAVHQAAEDSLDDYRPLTVLYIGDWDPSGLHMSEMDLPKRLDKYGGNVIFNRLALTVSDTGKGDLPSFPASDKSDDTRYRWFVSNFGTRCWELDAMSPVALRDRVEIAIVAHLDHEAWNRAEVAERAERDSLSSILSAWPSISRQASKYPSGPEAA